LVAGSGYAALGILGATAAVFRCDLLVLIAPAGLQLLAARRVAFFKAAFATAGAAAAGAALSILVDSVLWGRVLWPEFEVLWFNTADNKSSDWGVSPPLWYFYSALPRALLGALPLAVWGVCVERRVRGPVLVALSFVGLYSVLPHKELRFIFPALPLLNAAAACGAARSFRMKGGLGMIARLVVVGLGAGTLIATGVFTAASLANYPGGVALVSLQTAEPVEPALSVHIGNLAATSGVSRFLEARSAWIYSKEEDLQAGQLWGRAFDRLLTEWPEVEGYTCQATVLGFERLAIKKHLGFPLEVVKTPKIYVLARSEDQSTQACDDTSPIWG